jgi:hypothetical protein
MRRWEDIGIWSAAFFMRLRLEEGCLGLLLCSLLKVDTIDLTFVSRYTIELYFNL